MAEFEVTKFVDDAMSSIGRAWKDAWQTLINDTLDNAKQIFTMRLDLWIVFWNLSLFLAIETFLQSCLNAASPALLEAAIKQFPMPKEFGWRVATKTQCIRDVLEVLAIDSQEITQPTGLYSAVFLDYLINKLGTLKLLFSSPLAFLIKKITSRLIGLIITICTMAYSIFSTIVILGLLVIFAKKVSAGKFPKVLQQETPRMKALLVKGGSIRRRLPGGVPP